MGDDRKRICFVTYDMAMTGGVEQVTASLANELSSFFRVYIYNINHSGDLAYTLKGSVGYFPGKRGMRRLRTMMAGSFKIFLKYLRDHEIDVVIAMGNYPALIVSPTRFFSRAKFVYCDHGSLMGQWREKDITGIRFWNALSFHKTVTLTRKSRNAYMKRFRMSPGKLVNIYNWVDDEILSCNKTYDSTSKKILTVGRFDPIKGYHMLLEVARKVLPGHPGWQWEIMGEGEIFEEIRGRIEVLGLKNQVILRGNVQKAWKKYNEYAFLVMTSYREGLPVTLLEANGVGLPMISFDVHTGPDEIICQGKNGFLIRPYDIEGMASAIEKLMDHDEMRIRMAGRRINVKKFSKKRILREWIKLIEDMYEK